MKIFHVNHSYRGRFFDIKFCCKTTKEACERIDISYHYMLKYHGSGMKITDDKYFDNIKAVAYSSNAVRDIGHRNEIDFDEAKAIIDRIAKEVSDKWKI